LSLCLALPAYSQQDYQKWLQQQQSSFQDFKDKRDKAFTEFLQKDWEAFQTMQGVVRDTQPKPTVIPEADTEKLPPPPATDIPQVKDVELPAVPAAPAPAPVVKPDTGIPQKGTSVQVEFYGSPVRFTYDDAIRGSLDGAVSNQSISDYWARLGKSDYEPLVRQLQSAGQQLELNDWGYAVLIYHLGRTVYSGAENTPVLFTWFMLLKSGYNARVGYGSGQVYLLLASRNDVYDVPFLNLNNHRYYLIPLDGKKKTLAEVTTYDGDYPGADTAINFRIQHSPLVKDRAVRKTLQFKYRGQTYRVPVDLNANVMNFYSVYPQTDIPIYFGALMSDATGRSLLSPLKEIIREKPETEAVNILLRFVQTAFRYETDQAQFSAENYLFPEETLYYPASDCEDRAALFAYLVRNLLGLEVVGLDYPGHVSTAVQFSSNVGRDHLSYHGKTYTICDPTYIQADYGMTMPSVKGKQPKVFELPSVG